MPLRFCSDIDPFEINSEVLLSRLLFYGAVRILCVFLRFFNLTNLSCPRTCLHSVFYWHFYTNVAAGPVRLDYFSISNYGAGKASRLGG
jgi:hypothetical protein